MPIRSKAYTPALLLAECEQDTREDGLTDADGTTRCELTQWLRDHVDTCTIEDVEDLIRHSLTWGPATCAAIIRNAYRHNTGEAAFEIQRLYTGILAGYPFKTTRHFVEEFLRAPHPGGPWDSVALNRLVSIIVKHHKRAKDFLRQPIVRANLPSGFDVEALPDAVEAA